MGQVLFTLLATYAVMWLSPPGHGDAVERHGKQLFNRLIAALVAYAKDGIPVFLASVPQRRGAPGIRPELASWSDAPIPRSELVGVPALVGDDGSAVRTS